MTRALLLAAYVVASAVNITGQVLDDDTLRDASKPLLMPLLLAFLLTFGPLSTRLLRWTAVGVLFSWFGDLALMPAGDTWFLVGLVGFLVAQVAYSTAFATRFASSPIAANKAYALPYVAWWLLLVLVLAPDLGGLVVPVAVYGAVLCTMAALATGVHRLATVGALFFVVSDSLLAATSLSDRMTFAGSDAAVMTTYCVGQLLLVLGVLAASDRGVARAALSGANPGDGRRRP